MSGKTITHHSTATVERITTAREGTVAPSRAARELGLRKDEFDIAVDLGRIRTVPDDGGGGRRVPRAELQRVRTDVGFPDALRERVRTVGTTDGAALLEVTKARFTRLARLGLLVPTTFSLNRYRAVVWRYLADDLREFAADEQNAALLTGRTPEGLRDQLAEGLDLRPRNWRGRHLAWLLRRTEDPWARAAAVASLLDPVDVSEVVTDPYERSHLSRFRPARPVHGSPGSPAAQIAEEIVTAADPDEIDLLRADLARAVRHARVLRAAPRPAARAQHQGPAPAPAPHEHRRTPAAHGHRPARPALRPVPDPPAPAPARHRAEEPGRIRGLLGRLRRRGS
ncbi:DUF6397 family protein [Streptomyces flaveolus]|uniref:DUF6397 family protein n=1 Tax=Streptomyces flaveolus TaxID=67297 RepID=UPI00166FA721|nr:DUF6397 family protein [Streptomyces flaveolus]GGQ72092.1 hypothetical protein GCM10010216_37600 [Streptomyces flaveolus]